MAKHPTILLLALSMACLSATLAADDEEPEATHVEAPISDFDRLHWSFQPLARPSVPQATDGMPATNPIDLFINSRLEQEGLTPLPNAKRSTLIRRLTIDLLGRPPSVEELLSFESATAPDAYEQLVDQLLASPEYGIRWGQHWLDLARFAETDGFEHDKTRPDAWRYRDWVVEALNDDLAYDEFVRWQLAGDELAKSEAALDAEQAKTATGFCLAGPDMPDINSMEERKHHLLNEIASTVGSVFLGLQVGCAQCHDHIYDPISQADFYRLRSFFEPSLLLQKNISVSHFDGVKDPKVQSHLMVRGDWQRTGIKLEPQFLRVANLSNAKPTQDEGSVPPEGRRLALANWIVNADNPLAARVITNRIWHYHFGRGLSSTPSDFGLMGFEPNHPELLDWLSSELIESQWSLKRLHRLILTSNSYRRASGVALLDEGDSSEFSEALKHAHDVDPRNQWLSRFPLQRLTGEVLRDAMLFVSSSLNDEMGGPGIRPPLPPELTTTLLKDQWKVTEDTKQHFRRSVYIFVRRNLTYPIFDVFDRPSANASCDIRNKSTTATQSLLLLNSKFANEVASRWATQLLVDSKHDETRVKMAFLSAFARQPNPSELAQVLQFARDPAWQTGEANDVKAAKHRAWSAVCLALLNANEFVYLD